jgi:UPF0716 protein FxsA
MPPPDEKVCHDRVMASLLLLFIVVPAVELALLIEVGSRIGTLATLAIIVATGVLGAALAKQQGIRTVRVIQDELARGELPASSLVDGVIILVAGALLITPGILTDAVGFLCLVPAARDTMKRRLQRRFEGAVREQRIHVTTQIFDASRSGGPIYDVTPERPEPEDSDESPRRERLP